MNATFSQQREKSSQPLPSYLLPLTLVWNVISAIACILLSITILRLEDFGGLGTPVQVFVGIVVLIPVVALAYLTLGLFNQAPKSTLIRANYRDARYGLMFIYYITMVLSTVVLIWQVGVFSGLKFLVDGVMKAPWLLYLFVGAYAISWASGRLKENNPLRIWVVRASLLSGGIGLVILLINADIFNGVFAVLSAFKNPPIIAATVCSLVSARLATAYLNLGQHFDETPEQRQAWQGWLMLSPNILGFMVFFAGPLLLSLYLSFTNDTVGRVPEVVWLQNYQDIFSFEIKSQSLEESPQKALSFGFKVLATFENGNQRTVIGAKDDVFWISLRNTIYFCILLMPLAIIPAILLSLILNSSLPGMKVYRALYFLPSVAAVVGTALIWRWLYSPGIGYYNYIITNVISWFNQTFGLSINDPQIAWLTDPNVVLFSVVILAAWQVVGYNTTLFLAGLQGIPRELYEASEIDGANPVQQFFNVTLPMLRPTTFFVTINSMIVGLQVFNEPYALFPSRPIVENARTSVFYLYEQGFSQFHFGYASAIAWFLFLIIFTLTFLQFRLQRSEV